MKRGLVLFTLSIAISFIVISPFVREKITEFIGQSQRKVLSQLEINHQSVIYKVLKIKNKEGLAIEFYKFIEDELIFLDSYPLPGMKDAHYKFEEKKYNLFMKDVSKPLDGINELIIPSLDSQMKARLNIFHINYIDEKIEKI